MTDCACSADVRCLKRHVLMLEAVALEERAGRLRAEALCDGYAEKLADAFAALETLTGTRGVA